MKEEREEKIYKSLMLVVITVIITFLITSVTVYKAIAKNGIKYVKITDGEVTGLDETLASFRKVLEKEYLGEIDDETLVEGALKGYVEALGDPYTEYYTKEEMEKLMDTTNGNYVGIGIYMLVDKEKQTIVVLKPMENSPAEQAGILAGDIITKVDGEGYTLDTITEVSNKIKGKAGTKVKLEIKRGEKETFEIEVERKKILISHINTKVLKDNIGYIYISDFDGGCADEFTQKYKELKKQGIEKLIIDIRNNGGGIVDEAINILKLITDKGDTLLITKDKNENEKMPMASTTKIMTCIVALESGKMNQIIKVSSKAASMPKVKMYAKNGEQYYLKDLLYAMMLESFNDAAMIVAEGIGGSQEEFAKMMNKKAKEIGAKNTNFVTPNGLDADNHYSTAYDMALIGAYATKNKQFNEITNTKSYSFTDVSAKRSITVNNKDMFLAMDNEAIGIKTGFTGKAGYCFVGAVKSNGRHFVSCVLACGWPPNKSYKWKDTTALMNHGKREYNMSK